MAQRNAVIADAAQDFPVVGISAGRGPDVARNGEGRLNHRDNGPSNQAFATWRLVQRHPQMREPVRARSELALSGRRSDGIEDVAAQELRRRVLSCKFRHVVEIAVVQRREHRLEDVVRAPDVDDDALLRQVLADRTPRRRRRWRRGAPAPGRRVRHGNCGRS